jgi:glycosyltransferase involved in cell wall biosynthesis
VSALHERLVYPLLVYPLKVRLSVVLITHNEEGNLGRTLKSVQPLVRDGAGEIIVVDSGSTDRTVEIAKSFDAKVFEEPWKGFSAQKNSAIAKATGDWILSLDADEELDSDLQRALADTLGNLDEVSGFWLPRKNFFLGRWMQHGGFFPDAKLRLFRRGKGRFEDRTVNETLKVEGATARIRGGALLHHAYPSLSSYIEHMNRYSSLGAQMAAAQGRIRFPVFQIVFRPVATFIYNYIFRLGFLDGREGLLLHLYHAVYVSWKYAKAWEIERVGVSNLG